MAEHIYRNLETLSLMRNNLLPVISPEHMMSFSRVYASKLGERSEAKRIRGSCSIIKNQLTISHHHIRDNPISRNGIGKKRFCQSRCLRRTGDADVSKKFN